MCLHSLPVLTHEHGMLCSCRCCKQVREILRMSECTVYILQLYNPIQCGNAELDGVVNGRIFIVECFFSIYGRLPSDLPFWQGMKRYAAYRVFCQNMNNLTYQYSEATFQRLTFFMKIDLLSEQGPFGRPSSSIRVLLLSTMSSQALQVSGLSSLCWAAQAPVTGTRIERSAARQRYFIVPQIRQQGLIGVSSNWFPVR
jgi:hypothetical protein